MNWRSPLIERAPRNFELIMLLEKIPENFNPTEVVGCCVYCNGEVLLLLRQDHKSAGNKWGEPAGKVEKGEDKFDAIVRELFEETGISKNINELKFRGTYFFTGPNGDLTYHSFIIKLDKKPEIKINNAEHKKFLWATIEEALKLDLVYDLDFLISDL